MYLIVGLGNPGREYVKTRHNVGFAALDYLSLKYHIPLGRLKFRGSCGEGGIEGEKCLLLKPYTYMNLSGESVREAAEYFRIESHKIIVLYDDAALPVGGVRVRPSGSAGGHKGMSSIIYQLGTDQIPRVRFGVGAPKEDMVNHVLGGFGKEEGVLVTAAVKKTDEIIACIIKLGVGAAMNKFNGDKAQDE